MEKEELKEQVKKAFSVMHDDELYDAWDKFTQTMNYADTVTVFSMNELDDYFDGWNAKRLFNIFRDSPNFKTSDEYFSFYNGRLVSTASLNVDFKPIAYYLESAIDYVVENKDDLGNARLEGILDDTADKGTFMSFKEDFLKVLGTLTAEELIRVYNECISRNPNRMIYPMLEYILQEITENNNDFGIQKIKNLISAHEAYDDFD